MAKVDDIEPHAAGKPGMTQTAIALVLLTLVGGAGGGFLGYTLTGAPAGPPPDASPRAPAASENGDDRVDAHKNGGGHGATGKKAAEAVGSVVRELAPIVTNLGKPETSWIRLQAAIVYDPKELQHPEKLIAELTSDVTAFLRTATLESLEGSEGLRRLQEELSERAAIRSERKVREFIIETMVVQ